MGQLAKEITENSSGGFGANTKKNPKEECKVVITTSKRETIVDNECRTNEEKELEVEGEKENKGDQMEEIKKMKIRKKKMKNIKKKRWRGREKD